MARYEATWTVAIDVSEPGEADSTESLMLEMHIFVEADGIAGRLKDQLQRLPEGREVENVIVRPLGAQKR